MFLLPKPWSWSSSIILFLRNPFVWLFVFSIFRFPYSFFIFLWSNFCYMVSLPFSFFPLFFMKEYLNIRIFQLVRTMSSSKWIDGKSKNIFSFFLKKIIISLKKKITFRLFNWHETRIKLFMTDLFNLFSFHIFTFMFIINQKQYLHCNFKKIIIISSPI